MKIQAFEDRSRRGARVRAVGVLAAALLIVGVGCSDSSDDAGGDTTGTTVAAADDTSVLGPIDEASGEPVRIGFITDGKNDVTDQSIELPVAAATVEYINMHLGGIAGRPIELTTCEALTDPAASAGCSNQMIAEDMDAVVVGTVASAEAVWAPLNGAQMPSVYFAIGADAALDDPVATFNLTDPSATIVGVPISAAIENDEDKVTVVVIDVPAALAIYEGEGEQQFADAGIELDLVRVPPGTPDMVPQLQGVIGEDSGVVHVLGNDSFCISAFQALDALAFEGPRTAITQCISDATREALPPESLEGVVVGSASPVDANDESDLLYRTVMETYGTDIDTTRAAPYATFTTMAGLAVALGDLTGEVTQETITAAIKAMPERELPGSGGQTFRCDGSKVPGRPAICVRGGLVTTLDAEGRPTTYTPTQS